MISTVSRSRASVCTILLTAAAAAGCSSSGKQQAAPTSPAPAAPSAPPASAPAAVPAQPLKPGTPVPIVNGEYRTEATVMGYKQPLPSSYHTSRSDYEFAGLDAKVCVRQAPEPVEVSWEVWQLTFKDDTSETPMNVWADTWFSVPLYPGAGSGKAVRAGKCVRGWITFEVRKGKRPVLAEYAPESSSGAPVEGGPGWKL